MNRWTPLLAVSLVILALLLWRDLKPRHTIEQVAVVAGLHVVHPPAPYDYGTTFYLCQDRRGWADLARLPNDDGRLEQWRGVVLCQYAGGWTMFGDVNLAAEVERGMR